MPSSSFFHFYFLDYYCRSRFMCVNALHWASFISTMISITVQRKYWLYQCPSSGFSHFYRIDVSWSGGMSDCVNALLRASLISTQFRTHRWKCCNSVSMPFFGLLSFLQSIRRSLWRALYRVNALLRASLISTKYLPEVKPTYSACQCPSSGFSHFY